MEVRQKRRIASPPPKVLFPKKYKSVRKSARLAEAIRLEEIDSPPQSKSSRRIRAKSRGEFRCAHCSRTYTEAKTLARHQKINSIYKSSPKSALEIQKEAEGEKTAKAQHEFHCDRCSKSFTRKKYLSQHQKTVSCISSDSARKSPQALNTKVEIIYKEKEDEKGEKRVIHLQRTRYGCEHCSYKTRWKESSRKHKLVHTTELPFKCTNPGCNYRTRCNQNLRVHLLYLCKGKRVAGKKTESSSSSVLLYCSYPDCGYKNKRKDLVARHEKDYHSRSPLTKWHIQCRVCSKIETLVGYLHHMSSQHLDKLSCAWCLFLGKDLTEFKAHILAHTLTFKSASDESKGRYPCETCSRTFKSKSILRQHQKASWNYSNSEQNEIRVEKVVNVHSDERPFICSNLGCHYKSRFAKNLRRHQKSCRRSNVESETKIVETKQISGLDDMLCGNKTGVDAESSMAFACMLCSFIGDSESSALKHSRQHKTLVIMLNRI